MSAATSLGGIVSAITSLVRLARRKKKRQSETTTSPQDGWGAMILEQAGPMRSEPIIPTHQIDLGRRI